MLMIFVKKSRPFGPRSLRSGSFTRRLKMCSLRFAPRRTLARDSCAMQKVAAIRETRV